MCVAFSCSFNWEISMFWTILSSLEAYDLKLQNRIGLGISWLESQLSLFSDDLDANSKSLKKGSVFC